MAKRKWSMGSELRFREDGVLQLLIAGYAAFWIWMCIHPHAWSNWWLENILAWLTAAVLGGTFPFFRFTNISYLLIVSFLALHTYGAHYSYNATPLDTVMHSWFGLKRNNYDRVVHASFGLLGTYPAFEFLLRVTRVPRGWAYVIVPAILLGFGAFYELAEMWVAMLAAPDVGIRFLGMQGDQWDSQHDMEAQLYGAVATVLITASVYGRWKRGKL